jgi:hypothetical protein
MVGYTKVDLREWFTGKSFAYEHNYLSCDFSGFGSSYPAEDLPNSNQIVFIQDVPFLFPEKNDDSFNNLEFNNQTINVDIHNCSKIHILGACDNGSFKECVTLANKNEERKYEIGLTDWTNKNPYFNNIIAFRCKGSYSARLGFNENMSTTIWYTNVNLNEKLFDINSITFSDNPSIHIFAITLEGGK